MVFFGPQCRDDHYYMWMDFTARHQVNKTSQYFARSSSSICYSFFMAFSNKQTTDDARGTIKYLMDLKWGR